MDTIGYDVAIENTPAPAKRGERTKGEITMYALTVKQQTITSNSIDYLWHISRKLRRRGYAMIHLYRIEK